jgi:plasmid maintenance system killer protein
MNPARPKSRWSAIRKHLESSTEQVCSERPARLKLDRVEAAHILRDLAALPGNRFEALRGDRKGSVQHPDQRSMADLL